MNLREHLDRVAEHDIRARRAHRANMLLRSDCERLLVRIAALGDFDPFGDFNLLFGSALLNLRIRDLPVRYRDRSYGETNISRFSHGWLLLKMTWFGLWHLKFPRLRR